MAGKVHRHGSRLGEFNKGMAPDINDVLGVFTKNNAVLGLDVMGAIRLNDGIYSGPKGAYQRYTTSKAAADVAQTPYGSSI
jgi:hypothetical protein